ncbi:transposase-like protein [Bradyrhizobium sp. USDA 4461]
MPARAAGASSPAFIATAFAQDDAEAARAQWRRVADQLRPKLPKLAGFLDEAETETDVLAYMTFPPQHRTKLHSTDETDTRFFVRETTIAEIAASPFFCSAALRAILPSRPSISQPPRGGAVKAGRICGHRKAWP